MGERDYRTRWYQFDDAFRAEWERGRDWEQRVVQALKSYGVPRVRAGASGFRDDLDSRREWKNQADIWVGDFRIEVRSLARAFIAATDWDGDLVPIDPTWKFDGKSPRPLAYVIVSRPTQAMLVVWTELKKGFVVQKDVKDRKRGTTDDWFCVPADWDHLRPFDRFCGFLIGKVPAADPQAALFDEAGA